MYEYLDRRYALALYEVAENKGKVDEYLQFVEEVANLLSTNEELKQLFKHPQLSTSKKKELFKSIFEDKVEEELLTFLQLLIEKDRIFQLSEILDQMKKIYLEKHETVVAQVKTVVPLNEEEKAKLVDKLQKKYSKTVLLNEEIDKTILGGVYLRIGNDIIDGTIKSKFQEIRSLTLKRE
jgi:F-type H+-transporting ATPase subunit delta